MKKTKKSTRKRAEKVSVENTISSKNIALTAAEIAIAQKGLDVRVLNICKISDIADYFVLVSGTSERHVQGMCDKIKLALLSLGEKPTSINGYQRSQWILLDYSNVIVHIFYEPARQYYEFDSLWKKAQEVTLSDELETQRRKLRTKVDLKTT